MLKIKKKNIKEIELVIYLFCFIFAPPIIPKINLIYIVFIYSAIKLSTVKKSILYEIYCKSKVNKYLIGMIIAYLYITIIMLIGINIENVGVMNYIKTLYRFVLLIPVTITCIIYILVMAKELNFNSYDIIHATIKAGVIQAIISITMLIFPSVKEILVQFMFSNTGDKITQNAWVYQRRLYAFSNSILDSFGYGTGIIAALPLFLAYNNKFRYLLYIPVLIIVPLLNSRTGLIIFSIALIFTLPIYLMRFNIKKILKLILVLGIIIFTVNSGLKIVGNLNPITLDWVENGINEFIGLFYKDNSSNNLGYTESVNKLFGEQFWTLPQGIGIIFGTGHNIYGADGYAHSDVGYVNDIWLGGIIGIVLLYSPLIILSIRIVMNKEKIDIKLLAIYLIVSFIITNIKGYMINYNAGMAITLMILFSIIYLKPNTFMNDYKYNRSKSYNE